ncbi:hypothetical protein MMC28_000278 [Mycoblastus sanguinarius]|nr:hypothetical protein [Mycoblastus sanguinarius]
MVTITRENSSVCLKESSVSRGWGQMLFNVFLSSCRQGNLLRGFSKQAQKPRSPEAQKPRSSEAQKNTLFDEDDLLIHIQGWYHLKSRRADCVFDFPQISESTMSRYNGYSNRESQILSHYNDAVPQRKGNALSAPRRGDSKFQFVWPKDRKQTRAHWGNWSRWKDVITGKGPDIWIATQGSDLPHRPAWSGWKTDDFECNEFYGQGARWNNLGYPFQESEMVPLFDSAHRDSSVKYDFRSRRYCRPKPGAWSDVEWSSKKPHRPLYIRYRDGREWIDPDLDDRDFNRGDWEENTYAYNDYPNYWDWPPGQEEPMRRARFR